MKRLLLLILGVLLLASSNVSAQPPSGGNCTKNCPPTSWGSGTPDVTQTGGSGFFSGTLEVDGAVRFDGAITANSTLTLEGDFTIASDLIVVDVSTESQKWVKSGVESLWIPFNQFSGLGTGFEYGALLSQVTLSGNAVSASTPLISHMFDTSIHVTGGTPTTTIEGMRIYNSVPAANSVDNPDMRSTTLSVFFNHEGSGDFAGYKGIDITTEMETWGAGAVVGGVGGAGVSFTMGADTNIAGDITGWRAGMSLTPPGTLGGKMKAFEAGSMPAMPNQSYAFYDDNTNSKNFFKGEMEYNHVDNTSTAITSTATTDRWFFTKQLANDNDDNADLIDVAIALNSGAFTLNTGSVVTPNVCTASTDRWTATAHGFSNYERIRTTGMGAGECDLTTNTIYTVCNVTTNNFQLDDTDDCSSVINILADDNGISGDHTPVACDTADDIIITNGAHGLQIGHAIHNSGGADCGLTTDTIYYVCSIPQTNQFSIDTDEPCAGADFNLTDDYGDAISDTFSKAACSPADDLFYSTAAHNMATGQMLKTGAVSSDCGLANDTEYTVCTAANTYSFNLDVDTACTTADFDVANEDLVVAGTYTAIPDSFTFPDPEMHIQAECFFHGTENGWIEFYGDTDGNLVEKGTPVSMQVQAIGTDNNSVSIVGAAGGTVLTNEMGQTETITCSAMGDNFDR